MSNVKPSFYAILTANVRYDKNLTDGEKILFAEITALAEKTGICWAGNQYFADVHNVAVETISRRINKLKKLGHIKVEMQLAKGTKAIEKRLIRINHNYYNSDDLPIDINVDRPIDINVNTPIDTNVKDNNTSMNTTSNNKKLIEKKPPTKTMNPIYTEDMIMTTEFINDKKVNEKFQEFLINRMVKDRKVNTQFSINNLVNTLEGYTAEEQLQIIGDGIAGSYTGLFTDKVDRQRKFNQPKKTEVPYQLQREKKYIT